MQRMAAAGRWSKGCVPLVVLPAQCAAKHATPHIDVTLRQLRVVTPPGLCIVSERTTVLVQQ